MALQNQDAGLFPVSRTARRKLQTAESDGEAAQFGTTISLFHGMESL
jgi:hypothetical protein